MLLFSLLLLLLLKRKKEREKKKGGKGGMGLSLFTRFPRRLRYIRQRSAQSVC